MGETCNPELGKGENGFQLFWFKLFVFVILKPMWKQAGRGLVQKWGSHFFGGWPCKLLRISPSISFTETLSPAGLGCGWATGFKLQILANWWFSWAAGGELGQQDTAGIWLPASNFSSLFRRRDWDGSSIRSVTSGTSPNVTPFFSTHVLRDQQDAGSCVRQPSPASCPLCLSSEAESWDWQGSFHSTLPLCIGSCVYICLLCFLSRIFSAYMRFLAFPYRSHAGICRYRLSVK